MKKIILISLILVLVSGLFLSIKPAYSMIKGVRADQLAKSSLDVYKEAPDRSLVNDEVFLQASASCKLAPDRYWPNRVMGTLLTIHKPAESLRFWKQAILKKEHLSVDASVDYAKCLLANRKTLEAEKLLSELLEEYPDHPEVIYCFSRLKGILENSTASFQYAKKLINNTSARIAYHIYFIEKGCLSDLPEWRTEAINHLRFVIKNHDLLETEDLWRLAMIKEVPNDVATDLAAILKDGLQNFEQKLDWINYQFSHELITKKATLSYLDSQVNDNPESRLLYANWCTSHGYISRISKIIDDETALSRHDAYVMLLSSLIETKKWNRIDRLLENDSPPLDRFWFNAIKAKTEHIRGNDAKAISAWFKALKYKDGVVANMWVLVRLGEQLSLDTETQNLLQEILQQTEDPISVAKYLGSKYLKAKKYNDLLTMLNDLRIEFPKNSDILNEWAYYCFVIGQQVETAEAEINDLCLRFPQKLDYLMTWSMSQITKGRYREVLQRLKVVEVEWEKLYPKWQYILGLALAGVGEQEQALYYLNNVDFKQLSDPERNLLPETLRPSR